MKILYINTGRRFTTGHIAGMALEHEADLLFLTDFDPIYTTELSRALNKHQVKFRLVRDSNCPTITLFTKYSDLLLKVLIEAPESMILRISIPSLEKPLLLCAAYMREVLPFPTEMFHTELVPFISTVLHAEEMCDTKNTLIIGEFHINGERNMVSPGSQSVLNHIFYDSMWNLLGTYERISGEYLQNQLIIRPELSVYLTNRKKYSLENPISLELCI